ncbi:MAG: hypothetical protein MMC33_007406 [Icmadophila ericetorum]|nr:hypothetical protein [Icmadophila ericetorum]
MRTSPADGSAPSFADAYRTCRLTGCIHPRDDLDPLDGEDEDAAAASEYDDESDGDGGEQPDFATLAARHGHHDGAYTEEIEANLGKRDVDRAYDWHQSDH